MEFDYETLLDRRGKDALAIDSVGKKLWGVELAAPKEGFDFIPMWVADMNFATCPAIPRAIMDRASHPAYGYFLPREEYYSSIINWRAPGHPDLTREVIGYENGVHGFITSAVRALTKPGDPILLHNPHYVGFDMDVQGLSRKPVYSELTIDADGVWRMDYADMDRKIKENGIRVAIFCSPHNPTGRVWTREELEQALRIFEENNVTVISDEIWADLVFPGVTHTPLQSVNAWAKDHVVAAYAPSKTFNLAGLVGSYHIIYDKDLREKITKWGEKTHYNEMNVLSMHALIAAYSDEGRRWTDGLCSTLSDIAETVCTFVNDELPGVSVQMSQGTYMLFLDVSGYMAATGISLNDLLRRGYDYGVGWQSGALFGSDHAIRINIASPKARVQEALRRMKEYIFV